ncbi:hypothetical protein OE88DRAFT_1649249 [Heliocybe sulcata]|uniref:Uncharacterized protein n=1 Tax=Heliocybe sulcata TaxID=5364 RepID=A0A5C3MVI1_9AGAM|nr:hypothetical protein OE88DRAFT_1649249 [Heliocybe sulcata]
MLQFDMTIVYIHGKENTVADGLSRLPPNAFLEEWFNPTTEPHLAWHPTIAVTLQLAADAHILDQIKVITTSATSLGITEANGLCSLEGERRLYWRPRLFTLAASPRLYSPQRGDTLSIQRDSMQNDLFLSQELFLNLATTTPWLVPRSLGHRVILDRPSHSMSRWLFPSLPLPPVIAHAQGAHMHQLIASIIGFRLPPRDASLARPTTPFGTTTPPFGNYARHSSYCGTATSTQGLVRRSARTRLVTRFKLGYKCAPAGTAPQGDDRIGRRVRYRAVGAMCALWTSTWRRRWLAEDGFLFMCDCE